MKRRRGILSVWLVAVLGLLLAVGLLLAPPSALAAEVHVFSASFGAPGSGDGQLELAEHSGLAVNETSHDIYVADTGNHRVVQFSAAGAFIRAFGADVGGAGVNVCTSGCVAGTAGSAPGAFQAPTFVAVDNSGGASDGDVYVADTAAGLVSKFEADGTLISSWGTGGQLDGSTATEGPFGEIAGIAVDSTGTLDVLEVEPHLLFKFDESGAFVSEIATPRGSKQLGLAVDPDGNFFKVNLVPDVEKFESSGTDIGQVTFFSESITGLGVDPVDGQLFVDNGGSIDHYTFGPLGEVIVEGGGCAVEPFGGEDGIACPPTDNFGSGDLSTGAGLTVDGASASQAVYAADFGAAEIAVFELVTVPQAVTEEACLVGVTDATLCGSVNPNGAPLTECFFEWGETESYGETTPCEDPDAAEIGEGTAPVPVHADISGLNAGTVYHFRLVAANANGPSKGEDEQFKTLGPAIKDESASQVTATGARIAGSINPNGEETGFVVQYVTEAKFLETGYAEAKSVPTPEREVGSGIAFKEVIQQLSELNPETTYHFRLVATNAIATALGADKKFTTFPLPGAVLPDGRAYEMVSPPQKAGEVIPPEPGANLGESCNECLPGQNQQTMPMQSAPDGESVIYEGQPFSGGLAAGPNEYLSHRTSGGWGTQSLSEPTTTGLYEAFSSDLSRSVLSQVEPALSPEAPTLGGKSFANLYLQGQGGSPQPLVTEEPPNRESGAPSSGGNQFRIRYAGANSGTVSVPAFSHLIFEANDALTEVVPGIAPEAPEIEASDECTRSGVANCNLYEWDNGQLRLVNVLPGNASAASSAVIGSGRLLSGSPEYEAPDVDHAISTDGSRIFWSSEESGQVYVRIDGEETLEVPGPGSCKASVPLEEQACFLTASADGSEVLLSDGRIFALNEEFEAYDPTVDLTAGEGGFQGVLGAAEDLSQIYFVDTEALTGGEEENANEEHAEEGAFNLYSWSEGTTTLEDTTTFVGALLKTDNGLGQQVRYGDWKAARSNRTAQVSPDGSHLAFMSQASLVPGEDNSLSGGGACPGPGSGNPVCFEVYEYAAGSGTLSCASCNPSGQQPIGTSNLSLLRPGVPPASGYPPFPQPGNLSTDGQGRLFFESQDALSPQDTNGTVQDVYEWEPNGIGSCKHAGGCVFLISSGHSATDSMFLDSTPSGDDAFFITRQQLLPRDKDQQLDLYDARVGGGFEETTNPPCNPEACKQPLASPPIERSAGTPGFSGPGNPTPPKPACKKGFVRKHGRCVKKHKAKHHKKHKAKKHHAKSSRGAAK